MCRNALLKKMFIRFVGESQLRRVVNQFSGVQEGGGGACLDNVVQGVGGLENGVLLMDVIYV